jgi:hypothetical protein
LRLFQSAFKAFWKISILFEEISKKLRLFLWKRVFFKNTEVTTTFIEKLRHFERFWGFLRTISEKWRLLIIIFYKNYEVFKDNFREMEALVRNLRLSGGRKSEITRLFEDIFNGIEDFLKNPRLFSWMWNILKDFEAF